MKIDRQQWLQDRRKGIGGSDIAAILGMSRWTTALDLWLDKTGRDDSERDKSTLERMFWGTAHEDTIARRYAELSGCKIQRINIMMRHPEVSIAMANIDRAIVEPGRIARWNGTRVIGAKGVLECKTAHAFAESTDDWGEADTDEVPQNYYLQVLWYLGITRLPYADLAVLFGGNKFVTYRIQADNDLFADLLTEANNWWRRYIVTDRPPPATSEHDARRKWSSHLDGKTISVGASIANAVRDLRQAKSQVKTLQSDIQRLKDLILPAFGDAEAITRADARLATWKANKPTQKTDWESVAMEAGADAALIKHHTKEKPGPRVLRLTKEG